MQIHNSLGVSGAIVAQVHNHVTDETQIYETHNLVVDEGLNIIADLLTQQPSIVGITHFAVGTGTTEPTAADTALEAEVYRGAITRGSRSGTGIASLEYYLQRGAANGETLTEVALLSVKGNTTRLYARALLPAGIPKSKDYSITLSWLSQIKPEAS
jgi:hypothetical protein